MIDDDLILEADNIVERNAAPKKSVYLRYTAAAAACLCVAGGAAVIAKTRIVPDPVTTSVPMSADRDNSGKQISGNDLNNNAPVTKTPIIKMSEINFNESPVTGGLSMGSLALDAFYDILWNSEDITEYFGWDLTPVYIPEGLIPSESNSLARIYFNKDDGRIAIDRTALQFYDGYNEYGSPKCDEYNGPKGFELAASKIGKLDLCGVQCIRDGMTASNIGGTDVYFAHFPIRLGDVSNPRGYHHKYVAEFELDGISYRVTADQLESDEIVKIVSSIICGDNFSVEE